MRLDTDLYGCIPFWVHKSFENLGLVDGPSSFTVLEGTWWLSHSSVRITYPAESKVIQCVETEEKIIIVFCLPPKKHVEQQELKDYCSHVFKRVDLHNNILMKLHL